MTTAAYRTGSVLALGVLALAGLTAARVHGGYVLFHTLAEGFAVVVASGIFIVAWHTRRWFPNGYLPFLGVAFLFVGAFDALHAMAYKGVGVLNVVGADVPTQLWLCARFTQAGALLLAPAFLGRRIHAGWVAAAFAGWFGLALLAIFDWRVFPACFVEGQGGLTTFKVAGEYVVCAAFAAAAGMVWAARERFEPRVRRLLVSSMLVAIGSELCFTLYTDVYGAMNLAGHYLKIVSFYLVYRAIVHTGLSEPYALLVRELNRSKEAAEAASAAKDRFLAVLSHELRTPLTPVLPSVRLMESEPSCTPEQRELLAVIRRSVELEARLIDDLLDLTRITRGKVVLHRETTDVHRAIRDVADICAPDVDAKGLHLTLELRAARSCVEADPARLRQILWNLLKNAVKFTPEAGRVEVRTYNDDGSGDAGAGLVVEVRDTGIGIEADALGRIFDAFEQGDRAVTRRYGGLGLGLAISRSLAGLHGGTLAAASDGPGRGAVFTLRLPGARRVGPAAGASGPAPAKGVRILLVEDHEDTVRIMSRLLRAAGHSVVTAGSVADALRTADANAFDLLISDLGLPDGSGLELPRQILSRRGGVPVPAIALSGYGMDEDIRRCTEAGFHAHLVKPIDLPQLHQAIGRVVRG